MSAPRPWWSDDHGLGRKEPNMMIIGVDYHPSVQQTLQREFEEVIMVEV